MVCALGPEDVPELLALAREWNSGPIVIAPGAHGAVVREGGSVLAWTLLREMAPGMFVADELWCRPDRQGRGALGELARWIEDTVARIATQRGLPSAQLGGIVRFDNPAHRAALAKRGYEPVGEVRMKTIPALVNV